MKIDVLQAEVAALKTLVLSTSPTSPTKEFQSGGRTPFKKGHARNKSTSSAMGGSHQDLTMMQPIVKDCKEVMYKDHSFFADKLALLFCFTHVEHILNLHLMLTVLEIFFINERTFLTYQYVVIF